MIRGKYIVQKRVLKVLIQNVAFVLRQCVNGLKKMVRSIVANPATRKYYRDVWYVVR